jgi:putative DNA primase/helicase
VTLAERDKLAGFDIPRAAMADPHFPGLFIPMYGPTGEHVTAQWKPALPWANGDGKPQRYASPSGTTNRLDVHPSRVKELAATAVRLWVTEGGKKADSLASRGEVVVAITGVFNWRSRLGTLGDWEDVPLKGREVVVCFDADARGNRQALALIASGAVPVADLITHRLPSPRV